MKDVFSKVMAICIIPLIFLALWVASATPSTPRVIVIRTPRPTATPRPTTTPRPPATDVPAVVAPQAATPTVGPAPGWTDLQLTPKGEESFTLYTVKDGDTLWRIVESYYGVVTTKIVEDVVVYNNLPNGGNDIKEGSVIKLPKDLLQ